MVSHVSRYILSMGILEKADDHSVPSDGFKHTILSSDIDVALEPQPISKSLTWAEFYTVRAGSDDRIFNYYVTEQKTSRCHLGAVLAAKVG